jgi:hypothetical protein
MLADPIGDEGLKTDEVREAVKLLNSAVVGSRIGVVVLGPLDGIRPEASDVLLKTLEDFNPKSVQPILWAYDAGDVRGTIRSRCLEEWCPYGLDPETEFQEDALEVVRASLKRDWASVIDIVKERKGQERELLSATATVLSRAKGAKWVPLWLSVREALQYRNLSKNEVLAALLGEV